MIINHTEQLAKHLQIMIEEAMDRPYFHEDEHGSDSPLNLARKALKEYRESLK